MARDKVAVPFGMDEIVELERVCTDRDAEAALEFLSRRVLPAVRARLKAQ